ncbi:hypothetical protein [Desulfobacula sp.]|uniref:hypothetical protein n=1 Tax=Desulfobacula sp. TaxID=2593537 RepID=UPI002634585D|nr:hypothetical protein [Desulfobacula sp.]
MDGPKSLELYLAMFNGTHIPQTTNRCPRRQHSSIQKYIDTWSSSWFKAIKHYKDQLPSIRSSVRVIGLIPARNEEYRIQDCLSAIAYDVASSKMKEAFELIILENGYNNEVGPTAKAVCEWIKKNKPTFPIHTLQWSWVNKEKYPIAKARKILADLAIFRVYDSCPNHPIFLLSEDADIERIQSGRMRMALKKMDKELSIDAIRGVQERSIRALKQNHLVLLERRSWQFTELFLSSHFFRPPHIEIGNFYWNRVVTAGSNVFFSAEVYSLIGGYSEDVSVFEDMDIGQRISVLRGQYKNGHFDPCVDTVRRFPGREESSIARILLSLIQRTHVYEHDGTGFFDVDHIIKKPDSISRLLVELSPYTKLSEGNRWRFEILFTEALSELYRILNVELGKKIFRRVMYYLGFSPGSYVVSPKGSVQIKVTNDFLRLADRFAQQTTI